MPPQSPTVTATSESGVSASSETVELALIERRKIIRLLPVPLAIERNDDEIWAQWSEAVTYN